MHMGSIKIIIPAITTMNSATAGELSPIACKKLVRRWPLCACRKEIGSCSLLHKMVLYWRPCSTWPGVEIFLLLFSLTCQALSLVLDGADGPVACWHQVPQTSVRREMVLIFSVNDRELCIYTKFLCYY
jgi:hypothetical protein